MMKHLLCSLKLHDPICFPGFACIAGGRLLPTGRLRRDLGPCVAHPHCFSILNVIGIESTDSIFKAPLYWWVNWTMRNATVDPPDCPLCSLRVVGAHGDAASNTRRPIKRVLF